MYNEDCGHLVRNKKKKTYVCVHNTRFVRKSKALDLSDASMYFSFCTVLLIPKKFWSKHQWCKSSPVLVCRVYELVLGRIFLSCLSSRFGCFRLHFTIYHYRSLRRKKE
ncbi:hypothetical protein VPH35_091055 [Triticum aestivum]